jgi:two-component system, chemotaxis family, CheB/CheR fusion protein
MACAFNSETQENIVNKTHYIIGIGASAGGLEAIHELFDNFPSNTGFSFIVIQHLSPDYKSLLTELLSKHTGMKVFEARDGLELERDCVYVIPARKVLSVDKGKLRLEDKNDLHFPSNVIDIFFNSLAEEAGHHAVGIILSGTGSDGTEGVEAIKKHGGIVIVQDPASAKFDGMPHNAIATGAADLILPPNAISEELLSLISEPLLFKAGVNLNLSDNPALQEILDMVKGSTMQDFTHYKHPTITRRILKRMAYNRVSKVEGYLDFLRRNPHELKVLGKEFLIGVTRFFRDKEAFEALNEKVIKPLIEKKRHEKENTLKIWVVGCSTGEEVYSIAILFEELLGKEMQNNTEIKIFATDIDKDALDFAARGLYSAHIESDIPADLLNKYFTKEGSKYKINPDIRKKVVFAYHNISSDPPFSKMDLISCRNLLIYLNPALQKKVFSMLQFSINPDGYIFLGPSENIDAVKDYTIEISRKWKIYQFTGNGYGFNRELFSENISRSIRSTHFSNEKAFKNPHSYISEIFKDIIAEEYGYAGVYIDLNFEVKHAIGDFKKYLHLPDKQLNFNLLKMVPSDLSITLGTIIRKAIKTKTKTTCRKVKVRNANSLQFLNLVVKPFLDKQEYMQPFLFVIINEESAEKFRFKRLQRSEDQAQNERVMELELELKETRDNLQLVVEELETSNEELQSTNEELISANEELQSTNEELQSLNEELHTVNAEHQLKIRELIELNDDLNNFFRSSEIGQIFLDKNLVIRKFTPAITSHINLIESDIGRSIKHISNNFRNVNIIESIQAVLSSSKIIEREIESENERLYHLRILPYLRQEGNVDGVIITLIDITEIVRLNSIISGVFNGSLNAVMAFRSVRDSSNNVVDLECIAANLATENILCLNRHEVVGMRLHKSIPVLSENGLFEKCKEVIKTGKNLFVEHYSEYGGRKRWFELEMIRMKDGVVVTFSDITSRKKTENELKQSYQELIMASEKLNKVNMDLEKTNYELWQFASIASHDLKEPLRKVQTYGSLLAQRCGTMLDASGLGYLDKILDASDRMQKLIEDILNFSRLSSSADAFEETDLNKLLEQIMDDMEILITEKKARLAIEKLPKLEVIPSQIRQVFQNLISNSLKFSEREPHIEIFAEVTKGRNIGKELLENEDYCRIFIKDNGIGFEQKFHEKIFDIFQRLHNRERYQGTGIGLAICKKIVHNHNGLISAKSVLNEGSTFVITLPVKHLRVKKLIEEIKNKKTYMVLTPETGNI